MVKKGRTKNLPSWKKPQLDNQLKRRQVALFVIFFLVFTPTALFLFFKNRPTWLNGHFSSSRPSILVLDSANVSLFSFDPAEPTLKVVSFPKNLYLKSAYGAGFYETEKLWQLAGLEKEVDSFEFVAQTLANLFMIPLPLVFKDDTQTVKIQTQEEVFQLLGFKGALFFLGNLNFLSQFQNDSRSAGNLLDWLRFWWAASRVPVAKVSFLSLDDSNFLETIVLPDGSEKLTLAPQALKVSLKDFFLDSRLRRENLKIEVLNATDQLGLAQKGAEIVGLLGGAVVRLDNYPLREEKCLLEADPQIKDSYTLSRLAEIFGCDTRQKEKTRVDLTLILGTQFAHRLR